MNIDNLYKDVEYNNSLYKPELVSLIIKSSDSDMLSIMMTAGGENPHPTVLLLHGFPGNERNFDLAQALRRTGINVLAFHYRGSWGSSGNFSFKNVLADVSVVLDFLKSEHAISTYRIDINNIFLIGHSMGGFAAHHTLAQDKTIKGCVAIAPYDFGLVANMYKNNTSIKEDLDNLLYEGALWLKGTSVDILYKELSDNADIWILSNIVSDLYKRKLLLIGASLDITSTLDIHITPLINNILNLNPSDFEYTILETDHSFEDKRIGLSEIIAKWLEQNIS